MGGIDPDPGGLGGGSPPAGSRGGAPGGGLGQSPQRNFEKNACNLLIFMHIMYEKKQLNMAIPRAIPGNEMRVVQF